MKIVTVLEAKLQFIKAALLSKGLRKKNHEIIIHTEHYDTEMLDIFLNQIPIHDYNFEIPDDFKNDSFYYKVY